MTAEVFVCALFMVLLNMTSLLGLVSLPPLFATFLAAGLKLGMHEPLLPPDLLLLLMLAAWSFKQRVVEGDLGFTSATVQ